MSRLITPKFQPAIADRDGFLAPLFFPDIEAIVLAHGVDEGIKMYTVQRLLLIYTFAGILPGFFKPLRGIASLCGNFLAKWFIGLNSWSRSGLSDANKRVPYTVFKDIYETLSKRVNSPFSMPRLDKAFGDFKIFDATYLQLCLKLVPWGKPQNQRSDKGQMKASVRIDEGGVVPDNVVLDSKSTHDDVHFEKLIDWAKSGFTYLFDRGFRRINTLVKIHRSANFFITRWNQSVSLTKVDNLPLCRERRGDIEVISDQKVRLGQGASKAGNLFRLITAISYRDKEPKTLYFLTNRFDLCPFDVATIYHHRWQIETFFKWLKSHLKINHLITYSENGVYSQIYMTLILNLLLAIYHKNRKLTSKFGINTQRAMMNDVINLAIKLGIEVGLSMDKMPHSSPPSIPSRPPKPMLPIYNMAIG